MGDRCRKEVNREGIFCSTLCKVWYFIEYAYKYHIPCDYDLLERWGIIKDRHATCGAVRSRVTERHSRLYDKLQDIKYRMACAACDEVPTAGRHPWHFSDFKKVCARIIVTEPARPGVSRILLDRKYRYWLCPDHCGCFDSPPGCPHAPDWIARRADPEGEGGYHHNVEFEIDCVGFIVRINTDAVCCPSCYLPLRMIDREKWEYVRKTDLLTTRRGKSILIVQARPLSFWGNFNKYDYLLFCSKSCAETHELRRPKCDVCSADISTSQYNPYCSLRCRKIKDQCACAIDNKTKFDPSTFFEEASDAIQREQLRRNGREPAV